MILSLFPRLAALGIFLLSSAFFPATSYDSDAVPKNARASSVRGAILIPYDEDNPNQTILIPYENEETQPAQRTVLMPYDEDTARRSVLIPLEASHQEEDPLIAELMRERDAALRKAQEAEEKAKDAEAKVTSQARVIELMRERDAAEKKAQETEEKTKEAEAIAARQAQEIAALKVKAATPVKQEPSASSAPSVPRPDALVIPEVARGYEDIYRRFLGGKLIYTDPTSKAKKELPIRALSHPLEETFDLSGCGDTSEYLSISTGYRKDVKPENANKLEIWIAPWFFLKKNLSSTAKQLQPIIGRLDATKDPVCLLWNWGSWSDLGWYDYLVMNSFEGLGSENLYEKWKKSGFRHHPACKHCSGDRPRSDYGRHGICFMFHF